MKLQEAKLSAQNLTTTKLSYGLNPIILRQSPMFILLWHKCTQVLTKYKRKKIDYFPSNSNNFHWLAHFFKFVLRCKIHGKRLTGLKCIAQWIYEFCIHIHVIFDTMLNIFSIPYAPSLPLIVNILPKTNLTSIIKDMFSLFMNYIKNEIIKFVPFCVWLILFHLVSLRFIHIVASVEMYPCSYSSLFFPCILLYEYAPNIFIHYSDDRDPSCFSLRLLWIRL